MLLPLKFVFFNKNKVWATSSVIWTFAGMYLLVSIITTASAWIGYSLSLNENQVLYLFSTSSQVIAGIYGLTLTGFIFFRNELSREEFEDETLADSIEALKMRYFYMLVFISALVIICILLCNLAISIESTVSVRLSAFIFNSGQSAFFISLLAVTYFVFDVISPKRIEIASRGLQDSIDPERSENSKGSLELFLMNYNRIESLLITAGLPFQQGTTNSYESKQRKMSNARLAEILASNDIIGKALFYKIRELIKLRNSIIHGAEPIVSQDIVELSSQVLTELEITLNSAYV